MVKQKLNNQGFTFVELVIAVAILSIITVSIAAFMATTSRVYSKTNNNNEVQSQALEVYDQISNCVMQANKVCIIGKESDGSGGYASDDSYYVSDNIDGVTGYETSTGKLINNKNRFITLNFKCVGKTDATATPKAFQFLKTESAGISSIKDVLVTAIYVEYQTKVGTGYETCYATFYVNDAGDLYLNRHYASDSDIANYTDSTGAKYACFDMSTSETSVLCKTLEDDGFKVSVDAENNSIGLVMNFDNYKMTYETLGMIKIRNKAILAR